MALALSAGSITLIQMRRTPWSVGFAAVLASVAITSKQSYVAALLAGLVFLCTTDIRLGILFGGTAAVALMGLAAAGHVFLGPGLWVALGGHSSHSLSFSIGASVLATVCSQPLVVTMLAAVLLVCSRMRWRPGDGASFAIHTPAAWYCLFTAGVLFATVWKEGSSGNYLLEPFMAVCMFVAAMPAQPAKSTDRLQLVLLSVALAACALWELLAAPAAAFDMTRMWHISNERIARERRAAIEQNVGPEPTLLNLASARLTAELPGEVNLSDPLYQLLMYDAAAIPIEPLMDCVVNHQFDAIVASPEILDRFAETDGHVGNLLRLVSIAYRPAGIHNDIILFLPRGDIREGSEVYGRSK
jgi:hypothetical protein